MHEEEVMKRKMNRFAGLCYALAIVAALGGGARELRSQVAFDCLNDGYQYLGACTTSEDCNARCTSGGSGFGGRCLGACCVCFI